MGIQALERQDTVANLREQRDRLTQALARRAEHHEHARALIARMLQERAALEQAHAQWHAHAAQAEALSAQMLAQLLRRHEEIVGGGRPDHGDGKVSMKRRLWQAWRPRRTPPGLRWLQPWLNRQRAARHPVAQVVRHSMLFDADWYAAQHADVQRAGMDPAYHYAIHGAREGRDPGPWFSTCAYLGLHPDVASAGLNALYHFEVHGRREGREWGSPAALPPPLDAPPTPKPPPDARQALMAQSDTALERFLASGARLVVGTQHAPQVSVILVLHNQAGLSFGCLRALQAVADVAFEVIVVDNASTDRTALLLAQLDGCRILRQSENLHFLRAANLGAAQARGPHLLFLNNDTQPQARSLGVASRLLDEMPDVGAVGGAIVLPDGTLQEAGCIVWRDGSCSGYGRGQNPDAPAYAFRRDVDYCSGAFLMVRRAVFEALGGFDLRYAPAYYEDTDLCMRVREAGLRVVYEPQARLLHVETASAPSQQAAGALVSANHVHFARRHARTLADAHRPVGEAPFLASMRLVDRGRVLFVDDMVPDPALGSGNRRASELLHALHAEGVFVTHCAISEEPRKASANRAFLPPTTELAPGGPTGLRQLLRERAGFYDAVIVSRPHNMQLWRTMVAKVPPWPAGTPVIYDAEAIFALRERLRQDVLHAAPADAQQQARDLADELALAEGATLVLAVNEAEAAHFRRAGTHDVRVLGHAVPIRDTGEGFSSRRDLLFVGRLAEVDSPNADSVRWFVHEVMPRLDALVGDTYTLNIVGRCHPALADAVCSERVRCHGRVEDLTPWYAGARAFVAPTRFAAGIPQKVHEAAAHGLPVVATRLLARQLGWSDGRHLLAADTAEAFAQACARVLTDEPTWGLLRREALAQVAADCDPARFASTVGALVRQVIPAAARRSPAVSAA